VGVGESQTTSGQGVDARRIDPTQITAVAFRVPNAEIIGKDKNDVRSVTVRESR
jgi:hypothetical protein